MSEPVIGATSDATGTRASAAGPARQSMRRRWRRLPRLVRQLLAGGVVAAIALTVAAGIPYAWTRIASHGHLFGEADAPSADVVMVLGAQVAAGNSGPMPFLRGRLETAALLVDRGHAKVILVSGDAHGGSGNETAVMTAYLTGPLGVDAARVVTDPDGLDTYDSCLRARRVYGVTRALVVTQPYHLGRAVALCRHVGIDADGVGARCDGCISVNVVRNAVRDYFACTKAAWDVLRDRPASIDSAPDPAVSDALARL